MAAISIMVSDNQNGVISNSFNFSEEDIKRIEKALGGVYKNQLGEGATARDIYATLSKALVAHIVNTCTEEEISCVVADYKTGVKPIELRGN